MYNLLRLSSLFYSITMLACETQLGLVIAPVTDLIGQQSNKTNHTLPIAGSAEACPRMHQLLFNETVEICKETQTAYRIRIPNLFFVIPTGNGPQNSYWVDKKAILSYKQLPAETDNYIPQPIDFRKPMRTKQQPIITLIRPWRSHVLRMTFSAGTRFVATEQQTRNVFIVSALHPITQKIIRLRIPKPYVLLQTEHTPEAARSIYNNILRSWTSAKEFIPYVWGGCSFIDMQSEKSSFSKNTHNNQTYYSFSNDTNSLKHGFDCAGLIARAAQIAHMPYYYKNTATLAAYLKPVKEYGDLKEGDLIWIPGHVMAVGNMQKNTIIEARHYNHGYGKVHEIALNAVFKGMQTFRDLFLTLKSGTAFERLNTKAEVVQTIKQMKLLSITSCYEQ